MNYETASREGTLSLFAAREWMAEFQKWRAKSGDLALRGGSWSGCCVTGYNLRYNRSRHGANGGIICNFIPIDPYINVIILKRT